MQTLKKFSSALRAAKLIDFFFGRASRGAAWPLHLNFLPPPMSWSSNSCCCTPKRHKKRSQTILSLKSKIILGGHVPHVPHPSSARFMRSGTCTLDPPFQNPRSATAFLYLCSYGHMPIDKFSMQISTPTTSLSRSIMP